MSYEDRVDDFLQSIQGLRDLAGVCAKSAARELISNQVIDLRSLLDDGEWDDSGEYKIYPPGSFDSFRHYVEECTDYGREPGEALLVGDPEDFDGGFDLDDVYEGRETPYLKACEEAWKKEHEEYQKRETRLVVEEILSALEVVAELHDIPFDRELALTMAKTLLHSDPEWDKSTC